MQICSLFEVFVQIYALWFTILITFLKVVSIFLHIESSSKLSALSMKYLQLEKDPMA